MFSDAFKHPGTNAALCRSDIKVFLLAKALRRPSNCRVQVSQSLLIDPLAFDLIYVAISIYGW